MLNCRAYLERETDILQPKAVLALGKIGWDVFLGILKHRGVIPARIGYRFAHGAEVELAQSGMHLFGVLPSKPAEYANRAVDSANVCDRAATHPKLPQTKRTGKTQKGRKRRVRGRSDAQNSEYFARKSVWIGWQLGGVRRQTLWSIRPFNFDPTHISH